jgi:hypothetical protein
MKNLLGIQIQPKIESCSGEVGDVGALRLQKVGRLLRAVDIPWRVSAKVTTTLHV